MKKSTVVLALALGFSICTVNASNNVASNHALTSQVNDVSVQPEEASPLEEVSPLCKAVALGDTEEVKRLLNNGVDVNAKSNGMMPIHYAAKYNRVDVIRVLITAGSKIHQSCDEGYTALRHAEKTNATDAAEFLMRFSRVKD